MHSRRLLGLGVLAAAVLVLAIGSGLLRPSVTGLAQAPPVAPPPQVGECLFAGAGGPWGVRDGQGGYRQNPFAREFGPCQGEWFGEIVDVQAGAQMTKDLISDRGLASARRACAEAERTYLDAPDLSTLDGTWQSTVLTDSVPIGPDPRQYAAGQSWQACLLSAPQWTADGRPVGDGVDGVAGTTGARLAGGWSDAGIRTRLGRCEDAGPGDRPGLFCGAPHDVEWLALGWWNTEAPPAAQLRTACVELAGRLMQRADPTAGGTLVAEVSVLGVAGAPTVVGDDAVLPESGSAQCRLRPTDPDQVLTGTLLGVGEGPVPLGQR